jgi:hypothetical protein
MTILGLVVAFLLFGVALAVASILDLLPGSLALFIAAVLLVGIILVLRLVKQRAFPLCKNGTCGVSDYEGLPVTGSTDKGLRFKCKCGDVYRWEGNHFYLIEEDGHEVLYKARKCIGFPWVDC